MDGDITQLPSEEEGPMTGELLVEGPKYIAWPVLVVLDEIPAPAARTLGGAGTSPTFNFFCFPFILLHFKSI